MTRPERAQIEAAESAYQEGKKELQFADRLLEGWAWSSRNTGLPRQTPVCTLGRLAKPTPSELADDQVRRPLDLSDAQYARVDRAVGQLPKPLRRVVFVEYYSPAPQTAKAARMSLRRADYRERLIAARWAIYATLLPDVERWRIELDGGRQQLVESR